MTRSFQLFDFDDFEVHGCAEAYDEGHRYIEQVDDKDAQFWTVYGHYSGEKGIHGVEALIDCCDRDSAELVQKLFAILRGGHIECWVANVAITRDIEALRKICLQYADWWNFKASRVLP